MALDAADGVGADRFREGYLSVGGDPALAERFLARVLPCESPDGRGGIDWTPGNPDYRTAAQFHPQTMAAIEAALGPLRYEDPYDVGRAAAWWVSRIGAEAAGTAAGWPVCWWIGSP